MVPTVDSAGSPPPPQAESAPRRTTDSGATARRATGRAAGVRMPSRIERPHVVACSVNDAIRSTWEECHVSGLTSDHARAAPDGTVTGRAEARRLKIRSAIASAAMGLVVERGLDDVTVDEIARAANVSRRTFFNYLQPNPPPGTPKTYHRNRRRGRLF